MHCSHCPFFLGGHNVTGVGGQAGKQAGSQSGKQTDRLERIDIVQAGQGVAKFCMHGTEPAYFNLAGNKSENGGT